METTANQNSTNLLGGKVEAVANPIAAEAKTDVIATTEVKESANTSSDDWLRHIKPSPFCEEHKQKQAEKEAALSQSVPSCNIVVVNDITSSSAVICEENSHNLTTLAPPRDRY